MIYGCIGEGVDGVEDGEGGFDGVDVGDGEAVAAVFLGFAAAAGFVFFFLCLFPGANSLLFGFKGFEEMDFDR